MTIYAILLDDLNSPLSDEWQASATEIGGFGALSAMVAHTGVIATFIKAAYTRTDIQAKSLTYLGTSHSGWIASLT